MTAITTKSRQMRLDNCALNTPKRVQIAGNLRENACKDREAATPADAANAGLENNRKIRQIHPNTKLLGKYRSCHIRVHAGGDERWHVQSFAQLSPAALDPFLSLPFP